jgi:integrase
MRGHIGQRGNSFFVSVYGGVDPETGKQRRHFRSFKQLDQAEHYLARMVDKRMSGQLLPSPKVTCGRFFDRWLEHYAKSHVAPTTFSSYQDIVRVHLRPAFANTLLSRLTPHQVLEYLSKKQSDGLSGTTCLYHYRLLHKILNDAVFWGDLGTNPADRVHAPQRREFEPTILGEEQVRRFLQEANATSRFYVLYHFAAVTGCRLGECLGLAWAHVDFGNKVAHIRQIAYKLRKDGHADWIYKEPKTRKSRRTVDLTDDMLTELKELQEARKIHKAFFGREYQDRNLVFCKENGVPPNNEVVLDDMRRVLKRAALPANVRFHDLRHFVATYLFAQGEPVKLVSDQLGHSNATTTLNVYAHVLPGGRRAAIEKMAARLAGKSKPEADSQS